MRSICLLAASLMMSAATAGEMPDLAAYDCTRSDSGARVPGDRLAADGFQVASRARFGDVNLMLIDPKTSVRANCFKRAAR